MPVEISIIIPLYNKEKYIIKTLKSVLHQDIDNWECIIIDDGSTDRSLQVVQEFCTSHPGNWRISSIQNSGQTKARNKGIRKAQGNYLTFLDADDLWLSNKLSTQFKYLEEHQDMFGVLSAYAIFKDNSNRFRIFRSVNFDRMLRGWASMRGFGGGLESVGMIRRKMQPDELFFDENLSTSAGLDFTIRCSQQGKFALLQQVGLLYRLSDGQWHTNSDELKSNASIIAERYSDYFQEDLDRSHKEYFYWIEVRKHGHLHLARMILIDLVNLRVSQLDMLIRLLVRNLRALILGRLKRRFILKQIQFLNNKELPLPL